MNELLDNIINQSIYCKSPLKNNKIMKHCPIEIGQCTFHLIANLFSCCHNFILYTNKYQNLHLPFEITNTDNVFTNEKIDNFKLIDNFTTNIECVIYSKNTILVDLPNIIPMTKDNFILIVTNYNELNVRKNTQSIIKKLNLHKIYEQQFITRFPNSIIYDKNYRYGQQTTFGNGLYICVLAK
jgi:hypothetical protein